MPKSRILVIDDEAPIRDSLKMTLEYEGYEFIGAATGQEGLALAERDAPDLVLLDVKMPGMDGIEVLERLRNMNESLPVVVVSGHGTISTAVEATKKGAFDFIEKPFASERVLVSLRNALDSRQLRDENRVLKKAVEIRHQMIGESAGLKHVMAAVSRAAPTNATVLITGESGVGKELVARTIHRNSLRSRERFVQVNCAAIPEELIESELFGHEKGSFTGATEKQIGKFEQADRGAIFLDEVGDMSAKTRELRNPVERRIIRPGGDTIDVADRPGGVRSPGAWSGGAGGQAPPKAPSDSDAAKAETLREFKENAERMFLVGKLRENGWNISKTAEVIGTPRSNLYKKLEQYQISQETDG